MTLKYIRSIGFLEIEVRARVREYRVRARVRIVKHPTIQIQVVLTLESVGLSPSDLKKRCNTSEYINTSPSATIPRIKCK